MTKEEFKKLILENYSPLPAGDEKCEWDGTQLIDGQWYAPLWGCDTIQQILDEIEEG